MSSKVIRKKIKKEINSQCSRTEMVKEIKKSANLAEEFSNRLDKSRFFDESKLHKRIDC